MTETKEGDMIFMHDCYETSVDAVLRLVDIFLEKGHHFVAVDQLIIE